MSINFFYTAYGLGIASQIPLPELMSKKVNIDAVLLLKSFGKSHELPKKRNNNNSLNFIYYSPQDICFTWNGEPLFRVKNGKEIIVNSETYINNVLFRSLILGQGMGVLLHQRGHLILHCSGVEINGGVVAFGGWPQDGKSTIVAALNKKGYPLVVDDVLAIKFDSKNKPLVLPGFPRIKLYEDVIEYMADETDTFEKIHPELKKFSYTAINKFKLTTLPLKIIYLLKKSNKNEITTNSSPDMLIDLIRQSYTIHLFDKNERSQNLHQCANLLKSTPLKQLKRDQSLEMLPQLTQIIEKDVFSLPNMKI
jgi:hypothetical protein